MSRAMIARNKSLQAKDYVILVAAGPVHSYLTQESEEDDGEHPSGPALTMFEEFAMRFELFTDARIELRLVVAKFPNHSFRIDTADALEGGN